MFKRVATALPVQASRAVQTATRPSFARAVAPAVQNAPVQRRQYHEKVLDHYNNPRNVGSMQKNASDVGTGLVGAPACGDVMKLQIKVDPNDERITDVKFKTFGCGSAIASSSYLTELVRGMTLEQAGKIRNTEIAKELCLPPVKRELQRTYLPSGECLSCLVHCSMLAEDAIKSAISNYYTKNPKAKQTDLGGTGASMPKIEIEKLPVDTPAAVTA